MEEIVVPVVAILSVFVAFPVILVAARFGGKLLKLKEEENRLRALELETERERLTVLRLIEESERAEKLGSRIGKLERGSDID